MAAGYGFVTYANSSGTQAALAAGSIDLNGQKVGITVSKSGPATPATRFTSPVGAMPRFGGPQTFAQQQAYAQKQQTFAQQQAYAQQQQQQQIYAQQQAYAQAQAQQQAYGLQQQHQQTPYGQQAVQYTTQQPQQASTSIGPQDYSVSVPQTQPQQPGQYAAQQQSQYTTQQYQQYVQQQQQQQYAQQYAVYQTQGTQASTTPSQSWADPAQSNVASAVQPIIYISGLPLTLTNADFLAFFQQFGQIANTNFQTGTPVAAIIFSSPDSTQLFCSVYDRLEIQGSKLSIQIAQAEAQTQQVAQPAPASQASPYYQQTAYPNPTNSQIYPAQAYSGTAPMLGSQIGATPTAGYTLHLGSF